MPDTVVAVAGGGIKGVAVGVAVAVGVDVAVGVAVGVGVLVGVGVSVGVGVGVGVGSMMIIGTRTSKATGSNSLVYGLSGPKIVNRMIAGPP